MKSDADNSVKLIFVAAFVLLAGIGTWIMVSHFRNPASPSSIVSIRGTPSFPPNARSAIILQRFASLHSLRAKFTRKVRYNVEQFIHLPGLRTYPNVYTNTFTGEFTFCDGDIRLDETATPETESALKDEGMPDFIRNIEVHTRLGRCESLIQQSGDDGKPQYLRGIRQSDEYPELWRMEMALGWRLYGHTLLSPESLQAHLSTDVGADNLITATYLPEKLRGLVHVQTFDMGKGGALISYVTQCSGNNLQIVDSDFRSVGGVQLPYKIETKILSPGNSPADSIEREVNGIVVSEYEVNPKLTPADIAIKWPEGIAPRPVGNSN